MCIQRKCVNWILDANIRGFFDNMSREYTMKFMERRVAYNRILRLIGKWLKAGVSEGGKWSETKAGAPQGSGHLAAAGERVSHLPSPTRPQRD
jgi:RNA-directed DNA polymerase